MIVRMQRFCLNIHAGYLCRHAGACCTVGWDIAAEPAVVHGLVTYFGQGHGSLFKHIGTSSGAPMILATRQDDVCVFLDHQARRCMVHRELGAEMLPSACRHFPRVAVTDARGTFVTLSHFCTTAAALLFVDQPVGIVTAPATLTLDGQVEGLDARDALPPLLRPGMLMDLDGYDAWERCAIQTLGCEGDNVDEAVARVAAATSEIQRWSPGGTPLPDHVEQAFEQVNDGPSLLNRGVPNTACDGDSFGRIPEPGSRTRRIVPRVEAVHAPVGFAEDAARDAMARAAVPDGLRAPEPPPDPWSTRDAVAAIWAEHDGVARRYLASKLFANWYAWQGAGVTTALEAVRVHAAVLRTEMARRLGVHGTSRELMLESIRAADFLMVHLTDSRELARCIDAALRGWRVRDGDRS